MKNHDLDAPISALRRRLMLGLPTGLALTTPFTLMSCGGSDDAEAPAAAAAAAPADKATIDAVVARLPAVQRSALKVGVALPAGSGVSLAGTTLLTANSSAQVAADGSSGVVLINASPQMAYLFGSGGRLLLAGVVEPGVRTTIDSRSTAEALIHIASQASLYGTAIEVALREVLRTHAIVEPVRLAVEAALARNGIDGEDAALMQAVAAAVAALRKPKAAAGTAARLQAQGLTAKTSPTQSGIALTPLADAFNTLVLTNTFRRRTWAWVAQTGYVDQAGNAKDLATPLPLANFALKATDALSFESLVTTVGDYVAGLIQDLGFLGEYERAAVIFNPVSAAPLELPILPQTNDIKASMAVYRTRVVGVGRTAGPALTAEEAAKLEELWGETLWNDILLPVIKNFVLPMISVRVDASLSKIAGQLLLAGTLDLTSLAVAGSYFPSTVAAMKAGDAKELLVQFFSEFFTSNTWSKILETAFAAFQSAGYPVILQAGFRDSAGTLVGLNLLDPGIAARQISDAMGKFAKVIIAIKSIVMIGDYAALAGDWDSSSKVAEFTTEVTGAKITLSPDPLLIDGVAVVTAITAKVEGLDAGLAPENVFLQWKCSGRYGDLYERGGSGLNDFQTLLTAPAQDYVGNGKKDDPAAPDTIEVKAFYRSPTTNNRVEIGTATVKVKFKKAYNLGLSPADLTVFPADTDMAVTAFIREKLPAGSKVAWEWTHAGVGSIAAQPANANAADNSVRFTSGSSEGSVTLTAKATIDIPAIGNQPPAIVILDPIRTTFQVRKNLTTLTYNADGGVYACTDPLACGVGEYTAFIVPRMDKAVLYRAVLSGYAFAGCNRSVTWTSTVGDGGGCNFPVTYFPHSSRGATDKWAVWIGFGGPFSGKCVVTITLKP